MQTRSHSVKPEDFLLPNKLHFPADESEKLLALKSKATRSAQQAWKYKNMVLPSPFEVVFDAYPRFQKKKIYILEL